MAYFSMTFDCDAPIQSMADGLRRWISHIEINKDKYDVEVLHSFDSYPSYGKIAVKYENRVLFYVNFYKKYRRSSDGKKTINACFTLSVYNEGADLYKGKRITLNVNDRLEVSYQGKNMNIAQALYELLPIRDENKVEKIASAFNIDFEHIKCDTYRKRYVIDIDIPELGNTKDKAPDEYYKYMSLSTFNKDPQ